MVPSTLTATASVVTLNAMLNSSEMADALRGGDAGVCSALDAYMETQQIYAESLAAMGVQSSPTLQVASAAEVTISVPRCSMSVVAHPHEHASIRTAE